MKCNPLQLELSGNFCIQFGKAILIMNIHLSHRESMVEYQTELVNDFRCGEDQKYDDDDDNDDHNDNDDDNDEDNDEKYDDNDK